MPLRKALKKISADKVLILLLCGLLGFLCLMNAHLLVQEGRRVIGKISRGESIRVKAETEYFAKELQSYFYRLYDFIDLNGLARRLMGQREMNQVYKLGNGHLAPPQMQPFDTSGYAQALISLYEQLQQRNIHMLYVQAPDKIDPGKSLLPPGVCDYGNQNADGLLRALGDAGVPLLDLRAKLREEGKDLDSIFFVTDLHWTAQGGFWGFREIARELHGRFGVETDPSIADESQYDVLTYENILLGSGAARTGRYFAGVDDISLLVPRFPTEVSLEVPSEGIARHNSYENVFFFKEHLYYGTQSYYAYMGENASQANIKNHLSGNGKKLVLVKDSFAMNMVSYFGVAFDEIVMIDLRFPSALSLLERIDAAAPDLVVFLYNPGGLYGEENAQFNFFQPTQYQMP